MRKTKIVCTIGPASESRRNVRKINESWYERSAFELLSW